MFSSSHHPILSAAPSTTADSVWRTILDWAGNTTYMSEITSTVILIVLVFALRWVLLREVRRHTDKGDELRRTWIVPLRNVMLLVLVMGLLIIWGTELRSIALSAVAIAAALVLATKELIMCVSGTLLEGTSRSFKIGDRIEVNGIRGDVYDQTLIATTLIEVGPGSTTHQHMGRMVTIPNSLFLSQAVVNETATSRYVLHVFSLPVKITDDWTKIESVILEAARIECATFFEDARSHMERLGQRRGIRSLSVEPRVTLQIIDPDRVNLVVRIPAPAGTRGRVEQRILRRVVPQLAAIREPAT